VAEWCREHRHLPIKEQWAALTSKLRGHFAYLSVTVWEGITISARWASGRNECVSAKWFPSGSLGSRTDRP
jgi:hypothetical protein